MDDINSDVLEELGEALYNWVEHTADLIERNPSETDLRAVAEWPSEAAGESAWAFQMLGEALGTEDLRTALRVVLFWGMGGLLHESLGAIGRESHLAERLTVRLRETGRIPFATVHDDEDNPEGPPEGPAEP